jgi:PAS domain S-box-containing protein
MSVKKSKSHLVYVPDGERDVATDGHAVALDNLPLPAMLLDDQRRILRFNRAAAAILGDVDSGTHHELCLSDALLQTGRGRVTVHLGDARRDFEARCSALHGSSNRLLLLEDHEAFLDGQDTEHVHTFIEHSHIGVYRTTPSGAFIMANPAMIAMLGYDSFDDIGARTFSEMGYHPDNPRSIFLQRMAEDGEVVGLESAWIRKDGTVLYVRENARAIRDGDGNIRYFEGTLEDISDRHQEEDLLAQQAEVLRSRKEQLEHRAVELSTLNEQLRKTEQELRQINASKDTFFSILAHDLRSPFATIMGFSDLLLADIESLTKDELKDVALQINKTTHHVYNLLNNLLAWSRIQTGGLDCQPIKVDLWETVINTVNMFMVHAIKKRIDVRNTVPVRLYAWADKTMLESILQNLISNAIKFTHEGGEVTIAASESEHGIDITVADNGMGMKDEQIARLFKINHQISTPGTAKEKGTGLGLILCHELVRILGGTIWVESHIGKGTVFHVTVASVAARSD